MAIEIPGWLQWVAPLAGSEWPQGNEDLQQDLGRSLKALSEELSTVLSDADRGITATQLAYPAGHGRDRMEQTLKTLRSGPGSLEDMVPAYQARGQQAEEFALAIRTTKLDILVTLGWAAVELIVAAAGGPGGWARSLEVMARTRLRSRFIGMALEKLIARLLSRTTVKSDTVARAIVEILEEAAEEVLQSAAQDAAIQKSNIDAGFQNTFDGNKLVQDAPISAFAGATGGLGAMGLHTKLAGTQWEQKGLKGLLGGAMTGAGAGVAGAAGAVLATGALTNQWNVNPLGFLSGAALGAGPSAITGARGRPAIPDVARSPGGGKTAPPSGATIPTTGARGSKSPNGTAADPVSSRNTKGTGSPTSGSGSPGGPSDGSTRHPGVPTDAGVRASGVPTAGLSAGAEQPTAGRTPAPASPVTAAADPTRAPSPEPHTSRAATGSPDQAPHTASAASGAPSTTSHSPSAATQSQSTASHAPSATTPPSDTATPPPGTATQSPPAAAHSPIAQTPSEVQTDSEAGAPAAGQPQSDSDHPAARTANVTAAESISPDQSAPVTGTTATTTQHSPPLDPAQVPPIPLPETHTDVVATPGTESAAAAVPTAVSTTPPAVSATATTATPNATAAPTTPAPSTRARPITPAETPPTTTPTGAVPQSRIQPGPNTSGATIPGPPSGPRPVNDPARTAGPADGQFPAAAGRPRAAATRSSSPPGIAGPIAAQRSDHPVPLDGTSLVPRTIEPNPVTVDTPVQDVAPDAGIARPETDRNDRGKLGDTRPHRGNAADVGHFRGDARSGPGDLTDSIVLNQIRQNLDLILPEGARWDPVEQRFDLHDADGHPFDVTIRVGPTRDGVVAEFASRPDNPGYDVNVSPRARDLDVARAVAHELAEIHLSHDPALVRDSNNDRPRILTAHLGGRYAEAKLLLGQVARAAADPARLQSLRRDLADLVDALGLRDGPSGSRALLAAHDPTLAEQLTESFDLARTLTWDAVEHLLPTDDNGYQIKPRDGEFLRLTPLKIRWWHDRDAPLGMTPEQFAEFQSGLFTALAVHDMSPEEVDVRLQGSSSNFFSGKHKKFAPVDQAEENPVTQQRLEEWFHGDTDRPMRRPFDSHFTIGLDPEPSDYDIQISSDAMVSKCREVWDTNDFDGEFINPKHGFVHKKCFEKTFPEVAEWANRESRAFEVDPWAEPHTHQFYREVVPALFTSAGPPDKSPGVSSHFRETDWKLERHRTET